MDNMNEAIIQDAYHTMDELYDHRTILFACLIEAYRDRYYHNEITGEATKIITWKSRKHSDGTYEEGWFIAGINTPFGQITYHQKSIYWNIFHCKELEKAPEYDGHSPKHVLTRLSQMIDYKG